MYYIINIGSNLGDRRLNLSRAMRRVGLEFGDFEISHVMESEPWGYESDNKFLNMGMIFQSDLTPEVALGKLQDIERELSPSAHRAPDGGYADRELDIDIMAIDDKVIDLPGLQVPHPRLGEREFFLKPMEELAPGWVHPVTGLTPAEMLMRLSARKNEDSSEENK